MSFIATDLPCGNLLQTFVLTVVLMNAVVHCHEESAFKQLMRFSVFVAISHVSEAMFPMFQKDPSQKHNVHH